MLLLIKPYISEEILIVTNKGVMFNKESENQ